MMTPREKYQTYCKMFDEATALEAAAEEGKTFKIHWASSYSLTVKPSKIHCFFMNVADEETGRFFLDFEYLDEAGRYNRIYKHSIDSVTITA